MAIRQREPRSRSAYSPLVQIALFITCLTDQFYPRAGIAAVKVLEHLGHEVVFPEGQTCCGQPMYNNGLADDARALAIRMIQVFEPYEHVVTPSGSCAAMFRHHYPELFSDGDAYHDAAVALAAKTHEFVEFLHRIEQVDLQALGVRWSGSATYHYSCHLRSLGMTDEAAQLAEQVEGLDYLPMEKPDMCCGFGGTFAIKYPTISAGMVQEKVTCVHQTGAKTLICNDAGCAMNIEGALRRENSAVHVKSMAEIIAEGFGLLDREDTK